MSARYQFLPWARAGAATGIARPDPLDASLPARVDLRVGLSVNDRVDVDLALRMYGPGDVTGIDSLQIVRMDPAPWTTDFEPNYFPSIEFDRPDFPWLFTPAAADSEGRLRPWLCLIVVRLQDGVHVRFSPGQPLPALTIEAPADPAIELPDLSESWAWCHSQVVTSVDGPSVSEHLSRDTPQTVSRLICPRRLEQNARYLACLVPAFAVGVAAGLGQDIGEEDLPTLEPAWQSGGEAPTRVVLPVFHQWEFATGAAGDFESLVRMLEGRPLPGGVGSKPMTADDPGFSLPGAGRLRFDGALTPPTGPPPPPVSSAFQTGLETLLDLAATARSDETGGPIVAPPIYGSRHASETRVAGSSGWLREMNLDPWARAVAGLGTLVVQDQQEQLMAAAWEQLGDLAEEPQVLDRPRFAGAVFDSIYRRRFGTLQPTQLFQLTAPAHGRLRLSDPRTPADPTALAADPTVRRVLGASILPPALTSAALRKVARPQSPLFRKVNRSLLRPRAHALLENSQAVLFEIARPPAPRPVDDTVTRQLVAGHVTRLRGLLAFGFPGGVPDPTGERDVLIRMIDAAAQVSDYYNGAIREQTLQASAPFLLRPLKDRLLGQLDPARTAAPRLRSEPDPAAGDPGAADAGDPGGEFATDGPSFPQPMYAALGDLSQEYLLPGAEKIPPNTVTLLQSNARFVEAYMVGLNHEMSRELLWREFPSDKRQTSFRHFWDDRGATPPGGGQIPQIHRWERSKALGEHFMGGRATGQLVLLIRGELFARYPSTLVYAVRARARNQLGTEKKTPLFSGALKPDMAFVGFDLSAVEARGDGADPGWFFVVEQQPTEPRFGLDAPVGFGRDPATIGSWNDLSWGDLVENETEFKALSYARVGGRLSGKQIGPVAWARNGGHMAAVTLQRPVRVAIHALDLLAPEP